VDPTRLERVDASGPGVECHEQSTGSWRVKGIMHTICTSNVDDSILLLMIFCCWLISLPI